MSNSLLEKEYIKANIATKDIKVFNQTIDISFLDVLANREVEVVIEDYKDCLCKDSNNLKNYYTKCNKCDGSGIIELNKHDLICNECKGEKYVRIHDCYLCNNEGKILVKSKFKVSLNDKLKQGDNLIYEFEGYKLILSINIYDKDEYLVKGNDIYKLRSVGYSKDDYAKKVNKKINTIKGIVNVMSKFKVKKEIVCIDEAGINGGKFYFIFENEVDIEKENKVANVLIDKSGYVLLKDLIEKDYCEAKESIDVAAKGYVYIDDSINEYENDNYKIMINKLDKDEFIIEDDKLVYLLRLDKEDINNDKKSFLINDEKLSVNFKKNLREIMYVNLNSKGLVNSNGKRIDFIVKIIPYYENTYMISIKKNKDVVYVDDYKYKNYKLVRSYKKSDYLQDYLTIKDEEKIYIGNDLVLIKRV